MAEREVSGGQEIKKVRFTVRGSLITVEEKLEPENQFFAQRRKDAKKGYLIQNGVYWRSGARIIFYGYQDNSSEWIFFANLGPKSPFEGGFRGMLRN